MHRLEAIPLNWYSVATSKQWMTGGDLLERRYITYMLTLQTQSLFNLHCFIAQLLMATLVSLSLEQSLYR